MEKRLRIKEIVKERGMTLMGLAQELGIYRSNMSAIASGSRGISLDMLTKMSSILDCSIDELVTARKEPAVFLNKKMQIELDLVEKANHDGAEKTWVNMIMLAGLNHYMKAKKAM